eukprot:gnl/TRDRNA2_/TRDRNA2_176388_c2_seq8.p1 gnl/TRDRNA2_/TRDRNA2_176388_c2~~gnl/TRDRNA2_/TRDRNA2_176388_c2_seq8.p1  ORF type:complete len:416 (+),score=9.70 gnl/TRDRNA2_/TRDRNA2_176388_c2_seq8:154-1248(+)
MSFADSMGLTLVFLDEVEEQQRVLHVCYDVPRMRMDLLQSREAGHVSFAFTSELRNRRIACPEPPISILNLTRPHDNSTLSMSYSDRYTFAKKAWEAGDYEHRGVCFSLPVYLDGRSGWFLPLTQCHKNSVCMARLRSFHSTPDAEVKIKEAYAILSKSLIGDGRYTCFHVNPTYGERFIERALWNPVVLDSNENQIGMANRTQLRRNLLLVSQADYRLKGELERYLNAEYGWPSSHIRVFTLGDLGVPSLPPKLPDYKIWKTEPYVQRAAISYGLCSPEYSNSHMGWCGSGFTIRMLMHALTCPVQGCRNNWTAQIFGSLGRGCIEFRNGGLFNSSPPWVHFVDSGTCGDVERTNVGVECRHG